MAPNLILGPLLRHVGPSDATIWVETDAPCEAGVVVAGTSHRSRTFSVERHHYALVRITDLEPGESYEYAVTLDGERVWPEPAHELPASVIRTIVPDDKLTLAFGSCRISVPHELPYTKKRGVFARGVGGGYERDVLYALALRMRDQPKEEWPDALLLLGDQIYADEVSEGTLEFIRSRRDTSQPPGEEVADFEEYTRLYWDAWKDPTIRWLLSTVPSSMIFDDHDVHDDWNTSETWVRQMRAKSWWEERIVGAFMSYWVYQHLGNLSPHDLEEDKLFTRVKKRRTRARYWASSPTRPIGRQVRVAGAFTATSAGGASSSWTRAPEGWSRRESAPCSTPRSGPGSRRWRQGTSTTSSSAPRYPSS
jgi:phosphodiesterase/alkaline phosphatase D-like protein